MNTNDTNSTPNSQLQRISDKLAQLGATKAALEQQVDRLRVECESLYKINAEMQLRIDELNEKRAELEMRQSQVSLVQDDARSHTKERISELVKEIDECITLLNS